MHAAVIAETLRDDGHDVVAVTEMPDLRGISDENLLEYGAVAERAVVTENIGDFVAIARRWVAAETPHAGLILTNPTRFNRASLAYPGVVIVALRDLLETSPITGDSWFWWL